MEIPPPAGIDLEEFPIDFDHDLRQMSSDRGLGGAHQDFFFREMEGKKGPKSKPRMRIRFDSLSLPP